MAVLRACLVALLLAGRVAGGGISFAERVGGLLTQQLGGCTADEPHPRFNLTACDDIVISEAGISKSVEIWAVFRAACQNYEAGGEYFCACKCQDFMANALLQLECYNACVLIQDRLASIETGPAPVSSTTAPASASSTVDPRPCLVDDDNTAVKRWSEELFGQTLTCADMQAMHVCETGDFTAQIRQWCPKTCRTPACFETPLFPAEPKDPRSSSPTPWLLAAAGIALVLAGLVLMAVRARRAHRATVNISEFFDGVEAPLIKPTVVVNSDDRHF